MQAAPDLRRPVAGHPSCWEPLIVKPARRRAPAVSDTLTAHAARGEGDLIGRKPQRFIAWLLDLLGADPAFDELGDWFPGSGIVGRSWQALGGQLSPRTWSDEPSLLSPSDASPGPDHDTSPGPAGDLSLVAIADDWSSSSASDNTSLVDARDR